MKQAVSMLGRATRDRDAILVVFLDDRLVIDDIVISDPRAVERSLGSTLRSRGLQTLRLRQGIDRDDVIAFAREMIGPQAKHEAAPAGSGRISTGTVSQGQPGGESDGEGGGGPAAAGLMRLCGPLASLHAGLRNESGFNSGELENIAEAVLYSCTKQSEAVLELVEIENHDQYTMAHSVNVSVLAGALARSVGIAEASVEQAVMAALLHDVGKREIPSSILLKNGPLSDSERRVVLKHPAAGARLLLERNDIPLLASVVAYEHHRRLDKRGYPEPASASTPGVASQIVQIADIYDALRSHRPYRQGMTVDEVLEIMWRDAGRAYDEALFEVFVDQVVRRSKRAVGAFPGQRAA
ncbi:MAG: HD domain-containing phosphohydrolase [Planctomycetota bacterium]